MHNNYYFLRQLSPEIEKRISGFTLVSCFSQNKDELITEFNDGKDSFFIKAGLLGDFQCLSFPESFHRARKNSVDLFNGLLMNKVTGVRQFANERSFGIALENENMLVYQMHAARSNVLWYQGDVVVEIFRNNFTADLDHPLHELDRIIDWSFEKFESCREDLKKLYITFGKPVWEYAEAREFGSMDATQQWKFLQEIRAQLENPRIYFVEDQSNISLSLLPVPFARKIDTGPIEALNQFFNYRVSASAFHKEKSSLITFLEGNLKQSDSFLNKTQQKLKELEVDTHYQQWGDLIMANLHTLGPGMEKVSLPDFYHEGHYVDIKLKKEFTPQKNAEVFYRKAKNQVIEINSLKGSIARKIKEIEALNNWMNAVQAAENIADLRRISTALKKDSPNRQEQVSLPYHEFEYKGFKIRVGKNATANDTLTLKHSFKDDLWLHAKDVAGSHVLVKYQSGKPFPKDVIERAAQLAAYHSKRKNESLCPVAVTTKKYVRKRKGDPAGMMVVEREDVVMVEPGK